MNKLNPHSLVFLRFRLWHLLLFVTISALVFAALAQHIHKRRHYARIVANWRHHGAYVKTTQSRIDHMIELALGEDICVPVAVDFKSPAATNYGWQQALDLGTIERLTVVGPGITDDELRRMRGAKHVSQVVLDSTAVTAEGVAEIEDSLGIQILQINRWGVSVIRAVEPPLSWGYCPTSLVRAVNHLVMVGQAHAVETIRESQVGASHNELDSLCVVCATLYLPTESADLEMKRVIGGLSWTGVDKLIFVGDLPFYCGTELRGVAFDSTAACNEAIASCLIRGKLRERVLTPQNDPSALARQARAIVDGTQHSGEAGEMLHRRVNRQLSEILSEAGAAPGQKGDIGRDHSVVLVWNAAEMKYCWVPFKNEVGGRPVQK
jgi:hypothetical protein